MCPTISDKTVHHVGNRCYFSVDNRANNNLNKVCNDIHQSFQCLMHKPLSIAVMRNTILFTEMQLYHTWTAIKLQSNGEWKREITEFRDGGEIKHFLNLFTRFQIVQKKSGILGEIGKFDDF